MKMTKGISNDKSKSFFLMELSEFIGYGNQS